jgi:hypothetical protein
LIFFLSTDFGNEKRESGFSGGLIWNKNVHVNHVFASSGGNQAKTEKKKKRKIIWGQNRPVGSQAKRKSPSMKYTNALRLLLLVLLGFDLFLS